ncbi:MAG TPA: glycine cleavage system protein GcvH [Candidatus Saccharimonadales bacterium]|nr:glycine cleavage system protein GcvH [Candidatus Saccharimonadales bacterium]
MFPENLKYTEEHEWVDLKESEATVGITFFAQKELGDVVFVDLPEVGRSLKKGDELGTVESVKAVSEIYAPVSGEVTEVNAGLQDHPEAVNEDPYGRGWMLKMKLTDAGETGSLMDAAAYQAHIGGAAAD